VKTVVTLCLLLPAAAAAQSVANTVDTSRWICEYCPFEDGARADVEAGAASVSDDSAYLGNATGYDEEGVYPVLDGDGAWIRDQYFLRWTAEDLGLDSRYAGLTGGKTGEFDYYVDYRELPWRRFQTTSTVFAVDSGDTLVLPPGWDPQPTTTAMSGQIEQNLGSRNIESDRSTLGLGGRMLTGGFTLSADYRRRRNEGNRIAGGSSFSNAAELPMPFDHVTDEVDLGARYGFGNGYVSVGWYLSDFDNENTALNWDHPFGAAALDGPLRYAMAQAPDSRLSQVSLGGGYAFPEIATVVSISAATGKIDQDTTLLPYTTNPDIDAPALPRTALGGEVDTTNVAVVLNSRPIDKTRVRFSYRYDERDNNTPRETWERVIVDAFPSGDPEMNIPYSFERSTLKVNGDYDLFDGLRVSAGYERRSIDRDFQEVAEQTEDTGWGRLRWRPAGGVELDFRAGASKRDIERYDESVAASFGQNPLLRKYNLAYRERDFAELSVAWSPAGLPVSLGFKSRYADDDYAKSVLGLLNGEEFAWSADLSWTVTDNSIAYLNLGIDELESEQAGSNAFSTPDWTASHDDSFTTIAAGFRILSINDKIDLDLGFVRSDGTSEIDIVTTDGPGSFPDLETTLDDIRLGVAWRTSDTLAIDVDLRYRRFETEDWALEGVGPVTIPVVLSLGAEPWDDDSLVVSVGFRYQLGGVSGEE